MDWLSRTRKRKLRRASRVRRKSAAPYNVEEPPATLCLQVVDRRALRLIFAVNASKLMPSHLSPAHRISPNMRCLPHALIAALFVGFAAAAVSAQDKSKA